MKVGNQEFVVAAVPLLLTLEVHVGVFRGKEFDTALFVVVE